MNNASAQQKIFPLVPEHAASDMSAVLHMIPAEKAGALPPWASRSPTMSRRVSAARLSPTFMRRRSISCEAAAVSPFYIRQARLSDVDALEGLVKYWAKQGENLPRKRADIIRNIDSFAICERDGRLVGCASLFVYDSGLAEIRSLGVAPDIQRQGQGRAIVEYLLERARRLDIDKVFVLTRNPKFFERVGFSLTKIDALPEKILKDCENCPKRARCDELAYEYNF